MLPAGIQYYSIEKNLVNMACITLNVGWNQWFRLFRWCNNARPDSVCIKLQEGLQEGPEIVTPTVFYHSFNYIDNYLPPQFK